MTLFNLIKDDSKLPLEVCLGSELRKAPTEAKGSHVFLNMVLADKILITGSLWLKYMIQHERNPINTLRRSSSYSLEHNHRLFLGLPYEYHEQFGSAYRLALALLKAEEFVTIFDGKIMPTYIEILNDLYKCKSTCG